VYEKASHVPQALEAGLSPEGVQGAWQERAEPDARGYPRVMPCHFPIEGYRGPAGRMVPTRGKSLAGVRLAVPCGQCAGCRIDKVREWSTRIAHEASMHSENVFVTLTYSDDFLPDNYSLNLRDYQLFMKRLRKALSPKKVRFYACGEYGEKQGRPHYHAILFGYRPDDAVVWRRSSKGHVYFRSGFLESLWGLGHVEFGDVTASNGAYVAGYALKKMRDADDPGKYRRVHPFTGECVDVVPEFAVMSRRPGIGMSWFEEFEGDCFPSDFVIVDGKKRTVPRAYKNKLRGRFEHAGSDPNRLCPVDDAKLAADRKKEFALAHSEDNTPERREVRERVTRLKIARFDNEYERDN